MYKCNICNKDIGTDKDNPVCVKKDGLSQILLCKGCYTK